MGGVEQTLGDAAEQESLDIAEASRTEDDHIRALLLGNLGEHLRRPCAGRLDRCQLDVHAFVGQVIDLLAYRSCHVDLIGHDVARPAAHHHPLMHMNRHDPTARAGEQPRIGQCTIGTW